MDEWDPTVVKAAQADYLKRCHASEVPKRGVNETIRRAFYAGAAWGFNKKKKTTGGIYEGQGAIADVCMGDAQKANAGTKTAEEREPEKMA